MNEQHDPIRDEAVGWAVRSRDPGFADWEAFTTWLEADPTHADAYDLVMLAADDAAALIAAEPAPATLAVADLPVPANDEPARTTRRRLIGFAFAASLLGVTSYAVLRPDSGAMQTIATAPGQRQTLALADGSRIEINGGSRLSIDKDRPRFARLDSGEAAFIIVHDAAHPFVVEAGGSVLQDAGTAFNVRRINRRTEVAVSEGLVIYNPKAEAVQLPPGRRLSVTDGRGPVTGTIATDAVTAWREGRLVYDGATLTEVAADLARNTGLRISVAPAIADRPFSGVITLGQGDDGLFERLGPLLGVDVRRGDQGWVLTTTS